jgi:hypothetical protein
MFVAYAILHGLMEPPGYNYFVVPVTLGVLWFLALRAGAKLFGTNVITRCVERLRLSGNIAAIGPLLDARSYSKSHKLQADQALREVASRVSEQDASVLTSADRVKIYGALIDGDSDFLKILLPVVERTGGRVELEVLEVLAGRRTISQFYNVCRDPAIQKSALHACNVIDRRLDLASQRESLLRPLETPANTYLRAAPSEAVDASQLLKPVLDRSAIDS